MAQFICEVSPRVVRKFSHHCWHGSARRR